MTLCDAGPLFALVDRRQAAHSRCKSTLISLRKPLITTWPCYTEGMYLVGRAGGWSLQRLLWRYVSSGVLSIYDLTVSDAMRSAQLMRQYMDAPMDLADASLVAAAETLDISHVFTLDSHFHAYRIGGKHPLYVVP